MTSNYISRDRGALGRFLAWAYFLELLIQAKIQSTYLIILGQDLKTSCGLIDF
jgi:hypothetical protein